VHHFPHHLILGGAVAVVTLALGVLTVNRLIRSKLRLSLFLLVVYVGLNLFLWRAAPTPDLERGLSSIEQLVLALALVNLLIALLLNPFRADRVRERFPRIVQDAITYGLFLLIGTFVMQERFLTTSAVGAVVLGFALQDTLGNMFGGLAIQVEKPFRVGHWIAVASFEGKVAEITWRATKLKTKAGNLVVVPNAAISKDAITNYSEPSVQTRLFVDFGATYDAPPNQVKEVVARAVANEPGVLKTPAPEIVIVDFGGSAFLYRVKFWIDDYAADDLVRDRVRSAIYYALRRHRIEIPLPSQIQYTRMDKRVGLSERAAEVQRLLAGIDLLMALTDGERASLVQSSQECLYGQGETIVQQGQPGTSMFVVCSGGARVIVQPSGQEVAVIQPGGYFGEMSLLTGEPRSATVVAIEDSVLVEITADAFRGVVLADPAILEKVSAVVESRRAVLDRARAATATEAAEPESPRGLLARVREFLRV
jgi:small-conductance mechanosensitive channel